MHVSYPVSIHLSAIRVKQMSPSLNGADLFDTRKRWHWWLRSTVPNRLRLDGSGRSVPRRLSIRKRRSDVPRCISVVVDDVLWSGTERCSHFSRKSSSQPVCSSWSIYYSCSVWKDFKQHRININQWVWSLQRLNSQTSLRVGTSSRQSKSSSD